MFTLINQHLIEKWSGTNDGNTYVPVNKLAYDKNHKKLGLVITEDGADSVIPFSSEANGTLKITGTLGSGTGYDGLSWSYSTVTITITIEEGVVTGQTISGNSVSSSAWSTSTNNHYGKASFSISSVEWIPAE